MSGHRERIKEFPKIAGYLYWIQQNDLTVIRAEAEKATGATWSQVKRYIQISLMRSRFEEILDPEAKEGDPPFRKVRNGEVARRIKFRPNRPNKRPGREKENV